MVAFPVFGKLSTNLEIVAFVETELVLLEKL